MNTNRGRRTIRWAALVPALLLVAAAAFAGVLDGGAASISPASLKEWLSYIASDELQGRDTYSAGLGLAAGYIQEHLRGWGVAPAGDPGQYLQTVRVLGVKTTSHASVTVKVGNETRTFHDGEGVAFPRNMGGNQKFTTDRVEFVGYGLDVPAANHEDYRGKDVRGAIVVYLGTSTPRGLDGTEYRRLMTGRNRYATDQKDAAASIGPRGAGGLGRGGAGAGGDAPGGGGRGSAPDFTTTQRLDRPIAPNITAEDEFFTFLFSRSKERYENLKRLADAHDALPSFRLDGVTLTFDVDASYEVVRTQLTHNVVGIVEGSDPALKDTFVAFGAHYDHVGYSNGQSGGRPPGRVTSGRNDDRIWNGADDDGSGTVTLMALARAFAEGPRPRRSLLFVWHAGEERGLLGSRYFADYPTVPMDAIVTQLNIDMIGRNRDDKPDESNTVYLVGSDRISSELHEINRAANRALPRPLTLDYEMNDPSDLEQVYYRSDHYSYAAKGIPIIFFTTGLHADYHANTDEVSKIEFDKMARIGQLVYETGVRVANLDHAPMRDNKGPRAGRDTK
jgi:peptidase M28-like protein